jgi:hypothetical protein
MEGALNDRAGLADKSFQTTGETLDTTAPAARTFIAGTAQFFRQYPLGMVAAAFSGGVLIGWLIADDLKTRLYAGREQGRLPSEDKAQRRAISRWETEGGALASTRKPKEMGDKL